MKLNLTYGCGWNPTNARLLAELSALAYSQATVVCEQTDTHAMVIEERDYVAIAFRGSNTLRNFITDAQCLRTGLEWDCHGVPAEVHDGFLRAYDSIIQPLHEQLKRIVVGTRPLFITGHSLGGALAILCALELKRAGYTIDSVYTYGQPRVGNSAFCRLYDYALGQHTWRHVYQLDLVARIPHFPSFGDPYRHVGEEIFLPVSGRPLLNPSQWTMITNDLAAAWRGLIARRSGALYLALYDHHVSNYTERLALP